MAGGSTGIIDNIVDGVFSANVAEAGNAWDVSLKQNLFLVNDAVYKATFEARSDDSREIIAGLGLDKEPYTNKTETISLTQIGFVRTNHYYSRLWRR